MPRSPMSVRSFNSSQRDLTTPKASHIRPASALSARHENAMRKNGSTMGKRKGTAAYDYMQRHGAPATIHGGHRFKGSYKGQPFADDFDVVMRDDGDDQDVSFEGMDNVRGEREGRWLLILANGQHAAMASTSSAESTTTDTTTIRSTVTAVHRMRARRRADHRPHRCAPGRCGPAAPAMRPPSQVRCSSRRTTTMRACIHWRRGPNRRWG